MSTDRTEDTQAQTPDTQASWKTWDLFNPTEEHQMLRRMVWDFSQKELEPQAAEHDQKERFNLKLFRKLGKLGLLGLTVPAQYGGSEMDAVAAVIVHEEMSRVDPGFCLAYLAHSMLCANNIAVNASPEQKKRWLPPLCSGEWVGAMAMSEPDAGTDVLGLSTQARRVVSPELEKEPGGGSYLVTGRKMWITNGAIDDKGTPCDCVLVYAKTGAEEGAGAGTGVGVGARTETGTGARTAGSGPVLPIFSETKHFCGGKKFPGLFCGTKNLS